MCGESRTLTQKASRFQWFIHTQTMWSLSLNYHFQSTNPTRSLLGFSSTMTVAIKDSKSIFLPLPSRISNNKWPMTRQVH